LRAAVAHHPAVGVASDRRLTRRSGPMVSALCGLLLVAVAEPAVTAAVTFDGSYTSKRVLMKSSSPQCVPSEDVSVTIDGNALTFTDGALSNFGIGFSLCRTGHSG
jgi:hypothetical protein